MWRPVWTVEEAFGASGAVVDAGHLSEQPQAGPEDPSHGRSGLAGVVVAHSGQPRGASSSLPPPQDHLLPFSLFSRFSQSKGYSVTFSRFSKLWEGIGENYLDLPEETTDNLLHLLVEFTAFK